MDDHQPVPVRHVAIGGTIPPTLKEAVHRLAVKRGITMRDAMEEALASWVARRYEDENE